MDIVEYMTTDNGNKRITVMENGRVEIDNGRRILRTRDFSSVEAACDYAAEIKYYLDNGGTLV